MKNFQVLILIILPKIQEYIRIPLYSSVRLNLTLLEHYFKALRNPVVFIASIYSSELKIEFIY